MDPGAIVATGKGLVLGSRLIYQARSVPGTHLYVTTCALVEADRERPGTAEHFASMPAVTVLDLDLPAALALTTADTWGNAHTEHAAQPTPDRISGAVVGTVTPDVWKGRPVRVLDLS